MIYDDNSKIIFVKSSSKPMLWVLIGFYEEISKLSLNYHQISSNTHLISSAEYAGLGM